MLRSASQQNRLKWYLLAAGITLATVGARALLAPILGFQLPFITLYPAVFIAAWAGGLGPALLATGLGVVSAISFFMPPFTLVISLGDPAIQVGAGIFTLAGVFAGAARTLPAQQHNSQR